MKGKLTTEVWYYNAPKFEVGTEFEIATAEQKKNFIEGLSMPMETRECLKAGGTIGRLGDRFRLIDAGTWEPVT